MLPALEMVQGILDEKGGPFSLKVVESWHGLEFCLEHPSLTWLVFRAQWRRPSPWKHRFLALAWLLRMGGRYHFLRCRGSDDQVAIFAEGLANHAVNFFTSDRQAPSPEVLRRYVQLLPRPDLLVAVHAPMEICLQRLEERQALPKRIQGSGREAISRFVRHQADGVNQVVGEARRCGWAVAAVDNVVALDQVKQEVSSFLDNILSGVTESTVTIGAAEW